MRRLSCWSLVTRDSDLPSWMQNPLDRSPHDADGGARMRTISKFSYFYISPRFWLIFTLFHMMQWYLQIFSVWSTGVGSTAGGALAVYHVIPLFAVTDTNLTGRGEGVRILPSHYDHIKQQHQRCLFPSLSLNFVTAIAAGGGGNWNDHFEFEILIWISRLVPNLHCTANVQ